MKQVQVDRIRNIAIIAHGSAGKTALAEAILYNAGATSRLGKINEGNTMMDFLPEEISRKISTSSATASIQWDGCQVNLIDTPGYQDFIVDTLYALMVCDGALLILSAISGVKVQTERLWKIARENGVPCVAFVNKMDRERADFKKAFGDVNTVLNANPVPVQVPIGSEADFKGVVDLIRMRAFIYKMDGSGEFEEKDIPAEMADEVNEYREKLVESAAEGEDALVEKYLDTGELSDEEIIRGLRAGVIAGQVIPVFCGSASLNIGARKLLDNLVALLPSPVDRGPVAGVDADGVETSRNPSVDDPFAAYVYKTFADPYAGKLTLFKVVSGSLKADSAFFNATREAKERCGNIFQLQGKKQTPVLELSAGQLGAVAKLKETRTGDTLCMESDPFILPPPKVPEPALSYAIVPKTKGDEEKVSSAIARLLDEDPSLRVSRDNETKENILSGMGQLHIEVTVGRMKEKFGVEVEMKIPKVPYRETIKGKSKLQSRYKKQSGGRGQYGDVWLEIEPLTDGSGFEFVDKIVGGVVPRQYIPAVEKGVRDAMAEGVLAGYPVTNVRVSLYDGSFHSVDSSEMAFKIAASMGFKKGFMEARPILLEPIVDLEVSVQDDYMGSVIGDLNSRRGKVVGVEPQSGSQLVRAQVPMAEVLTYAPDLRSMTEGRASFSQTFSHYEEVPAHLASGIIEKANEKKEKD
ncbi:MAG: elongation factor G [Deltaproteobacteria bacterium]|nr:elongation factor G [Deltaproteobacteria bacterium]